MNMNKKERNAMEQEIQILLFVPGEPPKRKEIPNTLKAFQQEVGGYIQSVRFADGMELICNEEGRLLDLPENRLGIRGTFFLVRTQGEEFVSLTDDDISHLMNLFMEAQT